VKERVIGKAAHISVGLSEVIQVAAIRIFSLFPGKTFEIEVGFEVRLGNWSQAEVARAMSG
jgi:hypothetical protein